MVRILLLFLLVSTLWLTGPAMAHLCDGCPGDCAPAAGVIRRDHEKGEGLIIKNKQNNNMVARMTQHKYWTVDDLFINHFLPKLMAMSTNLSAVAMEQMRIVGLLFDAKHLLETNRHVQEMQVQANRDYHPSESFCSFGTNIRSIAETESRGRFTQAALSAAQLDRQLGNYGQASGTQDEDFDARWEKFKSDYCDPRDNNWYDSTSGLEPVCAGGGAPIRRNRDIDFTRLVDVPRTLKVDFQTATPEDDEEDLIALSNNLYGHRTPTRSIEGLPNPDSGAQPFYYLLRSVLAKRAVAQESFSAIVGLKAEAETEGDTAQYLAYIAHQAGMEKADVEAHIGEKPSTYAQLELLSQTMFQSPDFFVTLYDKPANIARKKAALNAIELMLDRYLYESELRQEMLLSVLLTTSSRKEFDEVLKDTQRLNQNQGQ